jgi:hypothetical protein
LHKAVGPEVVTVFVGNGFEVTVVAEDVAEHPPTWVTVTLYVPLVVAVIEAVVAPVDQI